MSVTAIRETQPQPLAGGWEAYRAQAFALIKEQERASKTQRAEEVRDANRGN